MKDITVYIKSSFYGNKGYGTYKMVMEYKGIKKRLYKDNIESISDNRITLEAAVDSVKVLKESCNITFVTAGCFGIKSVTKETGSPKEKLKNFKHNADLKKEFWKLISEGDHKVFNVINKDRVEAVMIVKE